MIGLRNILVFFITVSSLYMFMACSGDEPETPEEPDQPEEPWISPFKSLIGCWMNLDETLAIEIRAGLVLSYVKVPTGLQTVEARILSPFDDFEIGYLENKSLKKMTVEIISFDENKIVLNNVDSYGGTLSSYIFHRISTEELMKYQSYVVISESGTVGEHGFVDLGLSVKWATANVAITPTEPTERGSYYSYGEVSPKESYTESNSLVYGKSFSQLVRSGVIDKEGNVTARYDAATVNWGADWRTPTNEEWYELTRKCYWEWVTVDGMNGMLAYGPNGNSIFFPAAGAMLEDGQKQYGETGRYGSASLFDTGSGTSWDVYTFFDNDSRPYGVRFITYAGYSIRPVMK